MAKQRYVNTKFWADPFIQDLDTETKLFYIYVLTNSHTNIAGVYEISIKTMTFETGLSKENILDCMHTLTKSDKIFYLSGWLGIKNFIKHQNLNPKIKRGIKIEMDRIPAKVREKLGNIDKLIIGYDSLSHPNTNTNTNTNPNPNTNTNPKAGKPAKRLCVKVSDSDYKRLVKDHGKACIDKKIKDLGIHINSKGDPYLNHCDTILSWISREGTKNNEIDIESIKENL